MVFSKREFMLLLHVKSVICFIVNITNIGKLNHISKREFVLLVHAKSFMYFTVHRTNMVRLNGISKKNLCCWFIVRHFYIFLYIERTWAG